MMQPLLCDAPSYYSKSSGIARNTSFMYLKESFDFVNHAYITVVKPQRIYMFVESILHFSFEFFEVVQKFTLVSKQINTAEIISCYDTKWTSIIYMNESK